MERERSRLSEAVWGTLLFLALMAGGCMQTKSAYSPDAGRTVESRPGALQFDIEGAAAREGGRTGISVQVSVPVGALPAARRRDAPAEYLVSIIGRDEGGGYVFDTTLTGTVSPGRPPSGAAERRDRYRVFFPAEGGAYLIDAFLEMENRDEPAERTVGVHVPSSDELPALSAITLTRSDDPLVVYALPAGRPDLEARATVFGAAGDEESELIWRLARLETDTARAEPPHWLTPNRAMITYRGVDVNARDTLLTRRTQVTGSETAQFDLPKLEEGVYWLEAQLASRSTERFLTVLPPEHPRVGGLEEMISALAYIANEEEWVHIHSGTTPAERKKRFDAYWGTLLPERAKARETIERYYERVEEANRRFSSFKAGWKTDRGMAYILFGEPLMVERRPDGITWRYTYNTDNPYGRLVFERVRLRELPYEQYVLQRQGYLAEAWREAREQWREGRAP